MAETLLLQAGVMFAAVAAVGVLADRAGVSPIPLYIVAGIAVNEYVAGGAGLPYVHESEFVAVGAELGIVFLLLFLGLEFDLGRLVRERSSLLRAGVADFAVNFAVGLALGWALFGSLRAGVLVAGIVYISSSAVITKTLLDLGWIANPESGPVLGTLVFEDLVIAVYLAVVSAVVLGGGTLAEAAPTVGVAVGFLAVLGVLVAVGEPALARLLDTNSAEYFVLRVVGLTVLVAGAALAVGVSEAVAAFFVGTALGTTEFAHVVEERLTPVKDTFAAVFFFWIGLLTDPAAVVGVLDVLAVAVAVSAPAKVVSGYYGGQAYGLTDRRSLRVGLALVTRGEFSLIIAAAATAAAGTTIPVALANDVYAFAVGYVLVMSVLGTVLMQYSGAVERYLPATG
ncbi:cation:proton antiporter [Halobacterium litoreum]|uniref:Cation:proton antiporter n=1 Tax=Halobacterium litoreum TaxID=2039234 RepID=A0ABD5NHW5_9EURY|nr:cation:proton antiporter [Halobacterium litoreum]UHH12386.1 cation:proton antiporter [Halobacterium litoreum]